MEVAKEGQKKPMGQGAQRALPLVAAKVPGGHCAQLAGPTAPAAEEFVPGGHFGQGSELKHPAGDT
jgi:hypothetical protein